MNTRKSHVIVLVSLSMLLLSRSVVAQNKELISWGTDYSFAQYATAQFDRQYIYVNQLGSIPLNNARVNTFSFTGDYNYFVHVDRGGWELEITAGAFSERLKLDKDQLYLDYKTEDVFSNNGGIRVGTAISRRLMGKHSASLYVSTGLNADIFKTPFQLNPLYYLFSGTQDNNNAQHQTINVALYKQYYIPPIGLRASLDMHWQDCIISFNTAYKNKDFGFAGNKQPLYNSNLIMEFKLAFVLGYKYN